MEGRQEARFAWIWPARCTPRQWPCCDLCTYCLHIQAAYVPRFLHALSAHTNDAHTGFGTFWSASGEVYEGQWLTGTYEGRGTYLYASSDVYEGEYHAGKRDGRGVYMYASGDVYEGEYKQGKMEGRGIYRLADGTAEVTLSVPSLLCRACASRMGGVCIRVLLTRPHAL